MKLGQKWPKPCPELRGYRWRDSEDGYVGCVVPAQWQDPRLFSRAHAEARTREELDEEVARQ